jgi:hypothetical protein
MIVQHVYGFGWQWYLCPIYRQVLSKGRNVLKNISGPSKYWQHSNYYPSVYYYHYRSNYEH